MREIKFRVWDTKRKSWYNVNIDYLLCEDNELLNGIFTRKDLIFNQFTGLKDKNNKEIYEGDILKLRDGYGSLVKVFFEDGIFLVNDESFDHGMPLLCQWNESSEIIGNINENKELLSKT